MGKGNSLYRDFRDAHRRKRLHGCRMLAWWHMLRLRHSAIYRPGAGTLHIYPCQWPDDFEAACRGAWVRRHWHIGHHRT